MAIGVKQHYLFVLKHVHNGNLGYRLRQERSKAAKTGSTTKGR